MHCHFKKIILNFINAIFKPLRVNPNKITVSNFAGKGYSDNPKYIAEELLRRNAKVKIIWLTDGHERNIFPNKIHTVKVKSLLSLYHLSSSKVWIDNIRNFHPINKKKGQIYLQTWHGSTGAKKVEKDAIDKLDKNYIASAKYDGSIIDGIIADNATQAKQFMRAFWLNKDAEILRIGLPRNDILLKNNKNQNYKNYLKNKYSLDEEAVYILYAPTFRDDYSTSGYDLDIDNILKAFSKLTHRKCILIIRMHPNIAKSYNTDYSKDTIINGNRYDDIQELYIISDFLITDYSSCMFDFAILNKPCFIYASDVKEYEKIRGIEKSFYNLPFEMSYSNTELLNNIENFDTTKYTARCDSYFKKYPSYNDGNASSKAVDWILEKMQK